MKYGERLLRLNSIQKKKIRKIKSLIWINFVILKNPVCLKSKLWDLFQDLGTIPAFNTASCKIKIKHNTPLKKR